jgi:hypothetical protein
MNGMGGLVSRVRDQRVLSGRGRYRRGRVDNNGRRGRIRDGISKGQWHSRSGGKSSGRGRCD